MALAMAMALAPTDLPAATALRTAIHVRQTAEKEGKHRVRRKENAQFAGNPHIVHATDKDMALELPYIQSTFPEPLPPYIPRNVLAPPAKRHPLNPHDANAGRFSLSLRGMRKNLRRSGFLTQTLIREIEGEMLGWLNETSPIRIGLDQSDMSLDGDTPKQVGSMGSIYEVSRTTLQLVWAIEQDAFARYLVHCCARYHEVVSFSKDTNGRRLTYLLRPNVQRPDRVAAAALQTPPATDLDYTTVNAESDVDSLAASVTSLDEGDTRISRPQARAALDTISEQERSRVYDSVDEDLELIDREDAMSMFSDFAEDMETGSLAASSEFVRITAATRPVALEERRNRATSSPSRSPARLPIRMMPNSMREKKQQPLRGHREQSFYEYLFC